jgi:uncharacterized protein DUF1302
MGGGLHALTVAIGCAAAAFAYAKDDMEDLFGVSAPAEQSAKWGGYGEFGMAWTYADPEHWSKLRGRVELGGSGSLTSAARWRLSVRADADGAYEVGHFYPEPVRRDQRTDFAVRDAYVDVSAGDWDFRLGRQQVVWGEMVGFFFADVVSARDLREFLLPEFEALRIPQWTARAEYFKDEFHAEFIWIPVPSYDDVGKPGAEFFPFPAAIPGTRFRVDQTPSQNLGHTNWGARLSTLKQGWDLSAFYYRSMDRSPTYYPLADGSFEPRHDTIQQGGGTITKDFGEFVLKSEFVYTHGRRFNLFSSSPPLFAMRPSDTAEYVVGVDIPTGDWRVNMQLFARTLFSWEPAMKVERNEPGASLLVNHKIRDDLEAEILAVSSLNQTDYMLRPKVVWRFAPAWRSQAGVDVFGGKPQGLFGRFDNRDRAYLEVRRDF